MFIFKIEQEQNQTITVGFQLKDVFHFTYDGKMLHVVFKEERTTLQQVQVPTQKGKEIKMEMQTRNVRDFFTIAVEDEETIQRFLKEIETI
jgi:hypothetical protein